MKSKKIKKIAKLIREEIKDETPRPTKIRSSIKEAENRISTDNWSEYDPEVSEKFKKMILNLVNYSNNINLNINSDNITISISDIKYVKSQKNLKVNAPVNYTEDNFTEMSLIRNAGFIINYGYRLKSNYKDEKLFDELHPIISKRLKEINAENFNEVWCILMRESGIMRDNNLDEIIK